MIAGTIVRGGFAFLTLLFAGVGAASRDARWYVASGLAGTVWWLWDWVYNCVLWPIGELFFRTLTSGSHMPPRSPPTTMQMIARLERRLEQPVSQQTDVKAALELADFYRVFQKDPVGARALIARMRERYPEDVALKQYEADPDY